VCGIRDKTLIINLPGSKKAVVECFEAIQAVIPHGIQLIRDEKQIIVATHKELQKDFRFPSPAKTEKLDKTVEKMDTNETVKNGNLGNMDMMSTSGFDSSLGNTSFASEMSEVSEVEDISDILNRSSSTMNEVKFDFVVSMQSAESFHLFPLPDCP
jgi:hypothetical protein